MNRSSLASLVPLAALAFAAMTVGCSEPDVAGFQGSNAQRSAGDDDDDSSAKTTKEPKSAKSAPTSTGDTAPATTPAPTTTTAPATTTPATTTPATTTSAQACFTHCVSPVPEAAAFDACSLKCAETDTACIDACYDSSKCAANALCDTALTQCGHKCPAS